jgi:outer membrane protein OmpA-like peptidoglycan-associated protein
MVNKSKNVVIELVKYLTINENSQIELTGHTDAVGSEEGNAVLSVERGLEESLQNRGNGESLVYNFDEGGRY